VQNLHRKKGKPKGKAEHVLVKVCVGPKPLRDRGGRQTVGKKKKGERETLRGCLGKGKPPT